MVSLHPDIYLDYVTCVLFSFFSPFFLNALRVLFFCETFKCIPRILYFAKKTQMKSSKFYLLLISILFLAACGPTKNVSFNIIQPAQITLPADAQTILLVDRTKYKSAAWNTIEGILTGELPTDDRVAVQEAMNTLKNNLLNSPRFNVKVYPERLY